MISDMFAEVAAKQPQIPGWCTPEKAMAMAATVIAMRPEISLEIGVWSGSSFLPLAFAHRAVNKGVAIGVDPWLPEKSAEGEVEANVNWWKSINHSMIYEGFLRYLKDFGLEQWTQIHRITSDQFIPPDNIGVLSVDGNHTGQSVKDVERYAPKVKLGGFVFMDDCGWQGNYVEHAVALLPFIGFQPVYAVQNKGSGGNDDWAVWQKIK